jgi:hypothetical protein
MRAVKIVATYDNDQRQNIVFVGRQNSDGKLDDDFEYFGYVTDWDDDVKNYLRYSFTMAQMGGQEAILEWGGFDVETQTSINVYQRRIVVGEKITRRESNEPSIYSVTEVTAIV